MPSEPQKDDGSQGVGQAHISYVVVLLAGGVCWRRKPGKISKMYPLIVSVSRTTYEAAGSVSYCRVAASCTVHKVPIITYSSSTPLLVEVRKRQSKKAVIKNILIALLVKYRVV